MGIQFPAGTAVNDTNCQITIAVNDRRQFALPSFAKSIEQTANGLPAEYYSDFFVMRQVFSPDRSAQVAKCINVQDLAFPTGLGSYRVQEDPTKPDR